jgi:predicted metalloprotease with PDZ domain
MHQLASTIFKTWNGKRFHISPLGPVEYSVPMRAKSLWFNEGFSDYYAEMLMARSGLTPSSAFYSAIDRWTHATEATQDAPFSNASLEELSSKQEKYDPALVNELREKGALMALLMDIEIRTQSNNRRSLDAVLSKMNKDAASGKTYDDNALIKTIGEYATVDLSDFYTRYIAGSETPPVEDYLNRMGASREQREPIAITGPLGFELALNKTGNAVLKEISNDDTGLAQAGLQPGDTIALVNGSRMSPIVLTSFKTSIQNGEPQRVGVLRNRKVVDVVVKPKERMVTIKRTPVKTIAKANPRQLALRKAMLGKQSVSTKRG